MRCCKLFALLICFCTLSHCCDCRGTADSSYVRLTLTALRQQVWQLASNKRNSSNADGTLCKRRTVSDVYFLLVAIPSDRQLNDVEISTLQSLRGSTKSMALSSRMTTENIAKKLDQYCNCPDEVLPFGNDSTLTWTEMDQWNSAKVLRASVRELEPVSYVIVTFSSDFLIEDAKFGLFSTPISSNGFQAYTIVATTLSIILTLVLLGLVAAIFWMTNNTGCCSQKKGSGGPNRPCNNYYCDSGRERPDTGIYMS